MHISLLLLCNKFHNDIHDDDDDTLVLLSMLDYANKDDIIPSESEERTTETFTFLLRCPLSSILPVYLTQFTVGQLVCLFACSCGL